MNVSIDLQNPITLPANGQSLEKSGDKFVVDSSDESHPFDWHNAYFELDFQITNNRVVYCMVWNSMLQVQAEKL